jgi:DNA-binding CsgD family transcriptional regulator
LFKTLVELEKVNSTAKVPTFLEEVARVYRLRTAAYLGVGIDGPTGGEPVVAVTYSSEWISRYRRRNYQRIDPVIQVGMRRLLPIDWSEFDLSNRKVKTLFGEASEFGLGKHGLSVPVQSRVGAHALFSVTSDATEHEWSRLRQIYMRDLHVLAAYLHARILQLEGKELSDDVLSKRERECLQWIAEGKTMWECSVILGLSANTVRAYVESARHKLDASSAAHAVTKALTGGLIGNRL